MDPHGENDTSLATDEIVNQLRGIVKYEVGYRAEKNEIVEIPDGGLQSSERGDLKTLKEEVQVEMCVDELNRTRRVGDHVVQSVASLRSTNHQREEGNDERKRGRDLRAAPEFSSVPDRTPDWVGWRSAGKDPVVDKTRILAHTA